MTFRCFGSWDFKAVNGNENENLIHLCIEISFSFPLTKLKISCSKLRLSSDRKSIVRVVLHVN